MGSTPNFQPCQIVCLEYENTRLYAEVIQNVTARQVCWLRPLMLTVLPSNTSQLQTLLEQAEVYDMRQGPDLLWPTNSLRIALDTEVIPLLSQLPTLATSEDDTAIRQQLNSFIHQVWQAHKQQL